ncbi:DUF406 family protein [Dongshaea marina]|uniref:DUF406 family protein n=1 Tax=Dongshaea marina TaxID=2047966 RepID=UPI000D3E60FF|nr:DUF406 family protein [Dongshaea marina]
MSVENKVQETCDACGAFAEIGTVIGEGDDILELSLSGDNEQQLKEQFAKCVALAKEIYADAKVEQSISSENGTVTLKGKIQFGCTAEKMIFEMRARSL